jgi:predicted MFS family arabinose efflux permease
VTQQLSSVDAAQSDRDRPHLPAAIWILTAGTFLMGTTEFVVAGILPEVATDFDVTVARAGLAITVFAVGMIVGAPTMAMLTLRLPRRLTLMLALAVFGFGHVASALTTNFDVLLVARFVSAVATGAFWAVAAVVASHAVAENARGRALGFVLGGGMLANVVGVPLGAFAGQAIGWRGPFWALAVLAFAMVFAVRAFVPAEAADRTAPSIRNELRSLRSGRIWLTLAICATVNAGVLSVYSYISPLLTDRTGLDASVVPLALLLFGIAALAGSVLGGRFGDRFPLGTPVVTASATVVIAAGLVIAGSAVAPTFALIALLGLVGLSANPVLVTLAVRYGGDAPTLPSAMATSIFNLGTAVGTGITGILISTTLGASAAPVVGVVAGALTFIPLLGLIAADRRQRQKDRTVEGTEH